MAGRPEGLTRAEGPCPSGVDPGGPTAYRCPHPTVPGPTWHPCGPWPLRACQQIHVPSSEGPRRLSGCSWELRSHTHPGGSRSRGQASPRAPRQDAGVGWPPGQDLGVGRPPGRYQAGWSRAPTAHILSSWPETQRGTHRSAVATQRRLSAAGRQPSGDLPAPSSRRPRWSFYPEELPPQPQARGSQAAPAAAPLPGSLLFSRLGPQWGAAVRHLLVTAGGPSPGLEVGAHQRPQGLGPQAACAGPKGRNGPSLPC